MNTKISAMEKTFAALEEIENDLAELEQVVAEKQRHIQFLKSAAADSLAQIDNLATQLDKVLEKNGSGNGSN